MRCHLLLWNFRGQAAEVNDAPHILCRTSGCEDLCHRLFGRFKFVAFLQRVEEVVGDLDAVECGRDRYRVTRVASINLNLICPRDVAEFLR